MYIWRVFYIDRVNVLFIKVFGLQHRAAYSYKRQLEKKLQRTSPPILALVAVRMLGLYCAGNLYIYIYISVCRCVMCLFAGICGLASKPECGKCSRAHPIVTARAHCRSSKRWGTKTSRIHIFRGKSTATCVSVSFALLLRPLRKVRR